MHTILDPITIRHALVFAKNMPLARQGFMWISFQGRVRTWAAVGHFMRICWGGSVARSIVVVPYNRQLHCKDSGNLRPVPRLWAEDEVGDSRDGPRRFHPL